MEAEEYAEPQERVRVKSKLEIPKLKFPLLNIIRRFILTETDDYVIRANLARTLLSPEAYVGACLGLLEKEGLLKSGFIPKVKNEVIKYCRYSIKWDGIGWDGCAYGLFPKIRGNYQVPSKREIAKYQRKNPKKYVEWDGRVHYIIRGDAFILAAQEASLPKNPKSDWICSCGFNNKYDTNRCTKCHKNRIEATEEIENKKRACNRCGGVIEMMRKNGKLRPDHGLKKCNLQLVSLIMDE